MKDLSARQTIHDQRARPKKINRLMRWAFAYKPDETHPMALLRSTIRVVLIIIHEYSSTHISLRASALTFSIILSMVPMLAMSTAILKGLGNENQLKTAAYLFIDQLDPQPDAASVLPEKATETASDNHTDATPPTTLNSHLHNAVETIFNYVDNTNFTAIGLFGVVGLLVTVVLVLSAVEDAMNAIWHTSRGRSLFRKVMDYLALLIVLPISINVAIAGEAILKSPHIMGYITTIIPSVWVIHMVLKLLPFIFITLSLMLMYLFFPHVRVKTSSALYGAVFASIFWFIVQRTYIVLQVGVAKYNAIYGSFATVPLFLLWIHLGWTFILLGAVLAHAIQNHRYYQLPGKKEQPRQRLQRALDVLLSIYKNFTQGRQVDMEQLQRDCPRESRADLMQTVFHLQQGKLLYAVHQNGDPTTYTPALPATKLATSEVVTLILGEKKTMPTIGGTLADQVVKAAAQAIRRKDFPEPYLTKTPTGQIVE